MAGKAGHRGWGKIRRLPSKRFQASYVGPDLVRHNAPKTFQARMDAEHWLSTERRLIERQEWTPPRQRLAELQARAITLGEYAERWLAERPLKLRTRQLYADQLHRLILPRLGQVPVKNITPEAVRAWHASLDEKVARRNKMALDTLRTVLNTAVTDELLAANPCRAVAVSQAAKTTAREPVVPTVEQLASLADAIVPRLRALVLLAGWCGLRWGEVAELRRMDISDGAVTVTVARAVSRDRETRTYRVDTPKTGVGRTVVVPPHIRSAVVEHLAEHVGAGADELLFPAARGGHMNDRVFSREYFADALKTVGLQGVRVHDLRHFAGTQTARVGNLKETMARLGHSTVKASLIYQSVVSGRDHEVAAALSALAGHVEPGESKPDETP